MKTSNSENDLGYFAIHPAPMFEAMCKVNPAAEFNHTTTHYGQLLYSLARVLGAHQILEIGLAQGFTSGFLAWAIKENNTRYQMNGKYYGIDIADKSYIQEAHDEAGLPTEIIQHPPGSVDFLEHPELWPKEWQKESFDLIFIDGWHHVPYVKKEIKLVYPLLKGNGNGYLVNHDIYSWCETLWPSIRDRQAPDIKGVMRPAFENLRLLPNYGLCISRKMEGYDYDKVFWPDGDQKEEVGFVT